jgi:DNA-binding response OmpR family regulator
VNLNKSLSEGIKNALEFKGISIEIADNYMEKLFNLEEQQKTDNIRLSVNIDCYDGRLFLDVVKDMIENGEIDIILTDKATERHVEYLNKLIEK